MKRVVLLERRTSGKRTSRRTLAYIYIYITRVVMEKLNILLFTELMNFEIKIILGKFRINF
jgi:hypothetical protein